MLVLNYMPFYIDSMLAYLIGALSVFLVMCLLDRNYITQKVFLAITFFCLRWQAMRIIVCINNEIFGLITPLLTSKSEMFWFLWTILECLRYLIFGFLSQYATVKCILWSYGCKRESMSGREFILLSMPSLLGMVSYGVVRYYSYIYTRDVGKDIYNLYGSHDLIIALFTLLSFAVILVTTYVFRQWKTQQETDRQREIFSAQMADLQNHISEVERLYRDVRSLRHDMGNHLMTLNRLYDRGEYDAARQYTDRLNEEFTQTSFGINSGNPVTDVILSGRKKEMEEKDIAFSCDFHYPLTEGVDSFDISIILNNALSNAIEAIERERGEVGVRRKQAQIYCSSGCRKNMYLIEIANSYDGELVIDQTSGLPRTTKSSEDHGFGLFAIRHVARKYFGDMEITKEYRKEAACCVLRIMLQLSKDRQTKL